MPAVDPDDEFFGDQESDSDRNSYTDRLGACDKRDGEDYPSDSFGNVANHDYRSREASVKTLSYLDGYDETKEEKLQVGFADGYRKSFHDAFKIGRRLGSLCGKVALNESATLGLQQDDKDTNNKSDEFTNGENRESTQINSSIHETANLVRQFLTDEILLGTKESAEKGYDEKLSKLEDALEKLKV